MAIQVVKQGETVTLTANFVNDSSAYFDPSVSKLIRITNPSHAFAVHDEAMVTDASVVGYWKYVYQVASDAPVGRWNYECIGSDGATPEVGMGDSYFVVEERIGS